MKSIAIYAGTFDPITYGHVDVIERAVSIFDSIIIGIAKRPKKSPLFSLKERVELAKRVLSKFPSVKVLGFNGLLLDLAKEHKAKIMIRGLRTVTDFDYEFQLACMNRRMSQNIETLFLVPDEKYMAISSSLVR